MSSETMLSARIHEYQKPLAVESIPKPSSVRGEAVLDTVGAENTISDSAKILGKGGALVVVGLFGGQIKIPLLPAMVNGHQIITSLWGNYNELKEVIELASQRKIKHAYQSFPLREINRAVDLLRHGEIMGRAVIVP